MRDKQIERIREIVDKIKPSYTGFGGEVEFIDVTDDGRVRIKTTGYCHR